MSHSKKPYKLATRVRKLAMSPDANMTDVEKTILDEIDAAFRENRKVEYRGHYLDKSEVEKRLPFLLQAMQLPPSRPRMHDMRRGRFGAHEEGVIPREEPHAKGIVKHSRRRRHAKHGTKRRHHHAKHGTKRRHHHAKRGGSNGNSWRSRLSRRSRPSSKPKRVIKAEKDLKAAQERYYQLVSDNEKKNREAIIKIEELKQRLEREKVERQHRIDAALVAIESALQESRRAIQRSTQQTAPLYTVPLYGGGTTSYGYKHPVDNIALRHSYAAVSPQSTCQAT